MSRLAMLLCLITQTVLAADAVQPLTITFTTDHAAIGPVSRSAPTYVFSLTRIRNGYYTSVEPADQRLVDATGIGLVALSYEHRRSWRSLWFAADLTTGAFGVGAPPDYPWAKRIAIGTDHFRKDAGGEIAQLTMNGELVEFIVARPQVGVWSALVTSMGSLDDGKQHGKITVSIQSLTPRVGTTDPPPKKLKKGDIVFIANSFTGEYGAAAVE